MKTPPADATDAGSHILMMMKRRRKKRMMIVVVIVVVVVNVFERKRRVKGEGSPQGQRGRGEGRRPSGG